MFSSINMDLIDSCVASSATICISCDMLQFQGQLVRLTSSQILAGMPLPHLGISPPPSVALIRGALKSGGALVILCISYCQYPLMSLSNASRPRRPYRFWIIFFALPKRSLNVFRLAARTHCSNPVVPISVIFTLFMIKSPPRIRW